MIKKIILIFIVALLGQMLWLSEIFFYHGWYSLHWLHHPIYAAYIGTFFAAALPLYFLHATKKQFIVLGLLLWTFNLLLFKYGKILCYAAFGRFSLLIPGGIYGFLFACFLGYAVQTIAYLFVVKKLGYSVTFLHFLVWSFFGWLCLPLSLVSLIVFGSPGDETNFIDAIKMGYPVFWSIFILSALVLFLKPKPIISPQP